MSLEISPQSQSLLEGEAARAGVSVDALIKRTFAPPPAPGREAQKARVLALLHQWQQECGMPLGPNGNAHTPFSDLLARWREEDAALSPEQVAVEHAFWQDYAQSQDSQPVEI